MSYSITSNFHNTIADSILREIRTNSSKFYYYLGKTIANNGSSVVETPYNNPKYENKIRNDMIMLKRINFNDVSFVVPRVNWSSGVIFDHYDDSYSPNNLSYSGSSSLENAKFYVVNSHYDVYFCLDNNNNKESTIEPLDTGYESFVTSDGYRWKFIMTIPLILRNKFLTEAFFPVTTAITSRHYNNGGIDNIIIINGGSGYSNTTTITAYSETGTGAVLVPLIESGVLVGVRIDNPGEGYINVNFLILDIFGAGTGASISCSLDKGDVQSFQSNVELNTIPGSIEFCKIENGGNNYSEPVVTISGDGAGCTGIVQINSSNQISKIVITNKGSGYSYATATITDAGGGTNAIVRPIVSPVSGHGKNAVKEMVASRLMFFCNVREDKVEGFSVNNDFRQFGVMKSPTDLSGKSFSATIGSTCYGTSASGSFNRSDFPDDMILYVYNPEHAGKRFLVISSDDNGLLLQSLDNFELTKEIVLKSLDTTKSYSCDTITQPNLDRMSGDILYVDNRDAFLKTDEQSINLRTIIKF
jgi:hypothetical protein